MDLEKIKKEVKDYMKGVGPCHDFSHTERVRNLALQIGKKENADLEIIELAAILHDVARKIEDESQGKICHAEKGAEISREILTREGYPKEKTEQVIHCILAHRFRKEKKPETKEAKAVHDADKLDSIGAIGIGRSFSFAGSLGALVHNPNINLKTAEAYGKEDSAYREFLVKLIKVKDRMCTKEGIRLAEERHRFMELFFDRINKEVKGEL